MDEVEMWFCPAHGWVPWAATHQIPATADVPAEVYCNVACGPEDGCGLRLDESARFRRV